MQAFFRHLLKGASVGGTLRRRRHGTGDRIPTTIRRCTPNFRATPLIVPTPCSYSRRIAENLGCFTSVDVLVTQANHPGLF